jgi:hypothetical protein
MRGAAQVLTGCCFGGYRGAVLVLGCGVGAGQGKKMRHRTMKMPTRKSRRERNSCCASSSALTSPPLLPARGRGREPLFGDGVCGPQASWLQKGLYRLLQDFRQRFPKIHPVLVTVQDENNQKSVDISGSKGEGGGGTYKSYSEKGRE